MLLVDVRYEREWPDEKLKEVQMMYARTREYGEVCGYFSDFCLCDDAMLAWAIDLGWDIDSAIAKTQEILSDALYVDKEPYYNFFCEIVGEAIDYIDQHLPPRDDEQMNKVNREE